MEAIPPSTPETPPTDAFASEDADERNTRSARQKCGCVDHG